jgi:hypothetical protein
MSNVKAESIVLDAFESAVAASLAAATDRNQWTHDSLQKFSLPFADVCTNGFGWVGAGGSEISADVCTR